MVEFFNADGEIFIAAVFGAFVSVAFCGVRLATGREKSSLERFSMTLAYVVTAGYLATIVPGISEPFQAFLAGLATDVLIRTLRRSAVEFAMSEDRLRDKQDVE